MKLPLSLTFAFATATASAGIVMHWDHDDSGPYAGGNINASSFTHTPAMVLDDFSDSTPKLTNGQSGYTGPTTYAGMRIEADTIDSGDFYRILYRPGEGMRFQFNDTDSTTTASPATIEHSFAAMWLKSDFINGADTSPGLSFSSVDSLSAAITHHNSTSEIRFVVREGSDYYISEYAATTFLDSTQLVELDFASGDGNWASWDPTNVDFDGGSATYSAQDFTDITGVGVFGKGSGLSDIRDFQATATAVPEPSTYALFLGLLAVGGIALRRRKQAKRSA